MHCGALKIRDLDLIPVPLAILLQMRDTQPLYVESAVSSLAMSWSLPMYSAAWPMQK